MNNNDVINAMNAINFAHQLFQSPSSREEEELLHLLSATQRRLQNMHQERFNHPAQECQ
ncbi:hypothetical protein [Enterobacter kobei]|uniref:hypothetical protein n=1 Tax=Enterobacter kobei TaxID=208224 RepID=UPI003CFA3488